MRFTPVGHISGIHQTRIDVTAQMPWLYIVAATGSKAMYIGETHERGGLIGRISHHFGSYSESTLKQRAEKIAGIRHLRGPYLIVCARLPFSEDNADFDGSSKKVRLAGESLLHTLVGLRFLNNHKGWSIISSTQGSALNIEELESSCESIYGCFESAYSFLETLSKAVPFQVIILDYELPESNPENSKNIGELIEDTEVLLYSWILKRLKQKHENWWHDAIPLSTRTQCVTRKEQESSTLPPEAYFTMIDLRIIIQKNWSLFSFVCEKVSGKTGKEKATSWIIELNEARKYWAHPIKRIHGQIEPSDMSALRKLVDQFKTEVSRN